MENRHKNIESSVKEEQAIKEEKWNNKKDYNPLENSLLCDYLVPPEEDKELVTEDYLIF